MRKTYFSHYLFIIVLLFSASYGCASAKSTAQSQQIEVTTLAGDDSRGSLIAAIKSANTQRADAANPVVIRFARNLTGEIVLSQDLPEIENHISIIGNVNNGQPSITINGSVNPEINGGLMGGYSPGFRLLYVTSGRTATFENLVLTKSNRSGLTNDGGTVTVKNCMFTYNLGIGKEHGSGGAIESQKGNLTVIGSYFFYNNGGMGGTDGQIGYGGAGAINLIDGNAVVINSSFFENEGGFGGIGVGSVAGAGALVAFNSNVSVINCTVANNFGEGSIVTGGAGGFVLIRGNMLVLQSTIVDNTGGAGLGGFDGLDFCSGGIHVLAGILTIGGNIIVGNVNGGDAETDIETQRSGEIRSLGNNLFGYANVEINGRGDTKGVAMRNVIATTSEGKANAQTVSGFLPTIALTANSPAKNRGTAITGISPVASNDPNARFFADAWNNYSSLVQADQNGQKRAANPSIGAVE